MRELVLRFKAKTPKFFRRVRNLSLAVMSASFAAAMFYEHLPAAVTATTSSSLVTTIAWAGAIAAAVAQLTKEDARA